MSSLSVLTSKNQQLLDLNIAGLIPFSVADWPGKITATVFLQGCPFNCDFCFNWQFIDSTVKGEIEWDDVLTLLLKRQGKLDAVVFSGGEPLRQRDTTRAIRQVKDLGFQVGLHTEGAYLNRLIGALTLVDWVGYDVKARAEDYREVVHADAGAAAWQGLDRLVASGVDYEIRTTTHPGSPQERHFEELVDRLRSHGVRNYALQKAVSTGARAFTYDAPGWDDRLLQMKAYAESAGFDTFIFRG